MNCALKPSPRVTRSSGSAFANGGNSLAAPMRALSVASTSASRRPLTVEGRSSQNLGDKIVLRFCSPGNAPSFTLFLLPAETSVEASVVEQQKGAAMAVRGCDSAFSKG
jgi:hypothetical protein